MSDRNTQRPFQQAALPAAMQASFSPQEQKIWSLCDGEHSIPAIAAGTRMPVDVIEHILRAWTNQGVLGWTPPQTTETEPIEELDVYDVEILEADEDSASSQDNFEQLVTAPVSAPVVSSPVSPGQPSSIASFKSVPTTTPTATRPLSPGSASVVAATTNISRTAVTPTASLKSSMTVPFSAPHSPPPPSAPAFSPGFMAVVQTSSESKTTQPDTTNQQEKPQIASSETTDHPASSDTKADSQTTASDVVASTERATRPDILTSAEMGSDRKKSASAGIVLFPERTTTAAPVVAGPAQTSGGGVLRSNVSTESTATSSTALKIPGSASGRWPKPGESLATASPAPSDTIFVTGRGGSEDSMRISGANRGPSPTGTGGASVPPLGSTMLKIPGAASGSATMMRNDLTMRIPGASSMHNELDDTSRFHVVGQNEGLAHSMSMNSQISAQRPSGQSGSLAASLVENRGAFVPTAASEAMASMMKEQRERARSIQEEKLAISQEEREIFEEAVWEAAHEGTREVRDKAVAGREVVTSLSRVIRTFQLYDANNMAVRDALTTLFKQLMAFMHEFDSMILVVNPWTMTMDDHVVYTNEDRDYNLAFRLYRDGVRGLQIRRGVNWEELAQFLKILGTRYSGALAMEDDMGTLFRKANLRFISVVAIEGFGFERYEDGQHTHIEKLFDRMEKYDPSEIWERPSNPDEPIRPKGGARGAILSSAIREENAQGVLRELKSRPVEGNPLADEVCQPLLAENSSERLHEHIVQLFRYIDKIVLDLSIVTGLEGIRHLLREYRNFLMTDGHPDGLKELLSRATRWTKMVDSRGRLLAPLAQELLDSFDDEEVIRRWMNSSRLRDEQGLFYPAVFDIVRWEGKDRRSILFHILAHEKAPRLKQTIRELLVQMGGSDISMYIEQLRDAPSALALELIDCLQQVGTVEAIEIIGTMIEDEDPAVQDKVIALAEKLFDGPENFAAIRGVMEHLLESENEAERMRAYRLIEGTDDRRWLNILRKELLSKRDRSDKEIVELTRLVARLDPKAILPSLLEWVAPPGMLSIERQWRKQLRLGAVAALGQIGGREAEKAVRDLMEQSDGILHGACLDAMREMRRNQNLDPKQLPKRLQDTKLVDLGMLEKTTASTVEKKEQHESPEDQDIHRLHDMMAKSLQHIDLQSENEFASLIREWGYQFILSLHMLIKNRSLYDANNEIFVRPLEEIAKSLEKLLEQQSVVTLVALEGQFYLNNVRIRTSSESAQQILAELSRTFQRLKMGGITIGFPLDPEEWRLLVDFLSGQGRGAGCREWRHIGTELNASGLHRYVEVFGPLRTVLSGERQQRGVRPLSEIFIDGCEIVEDAWYFAVRGQMPNPQPVRRLIHDLIDTLMDGRIRDLSVLAFEDPAEPMKTHWLQVTLLSLLIGHEMGLAAEPLADLGMAAFFHDVGHAVFIDPEVRRGDGWQTLNHQQAGMALLLKHRGFNEGKIKRLLTMQEHHHLATATSTQPTPVLYSRIVRIADVYDTLCSGLCGGVPLCPTDALERMSSGCPKLFDPSLMQALINRVGHYPPGTIVALNDSTVAISLGHKGTSETFDRPSLILVRDMRGREIPEQIIDLSQPPYERSRIMGIVPYDPWLEPKKRVIRRLWPRIAAALEAKAAALQTHNTQKHTTVAED